MPPVTGHQRGCWRQHENALCSDHLSSSLDIGTRYIKIWTVSLWWYKKACLLEYIFALTYFYLSVSWDFLPPSAPNSDKSDPSALGDSDCYFYTCPQSPDLLLRWLLLSSFFVSEDHNHHNLLLHMLIRKLHAVWRQDSNGLCICGDEKRLPMIYLKWGIF